jgi:hypothetical protein
VAAAPWLRPAQAPLGARVATGQRAASAWRAVAATVARSQKRFKVSRWRLLLDARGKIRATARNVTFVG